MMGIRLVLLLAMACGMTLVAQPTPGAQDRAAAPDPQEVLDLLRQHLPHTSEAELNRTAVNALVSGLAPRVMLVSERGDSPPPATTVVTRTNLFEESIAYVRVAGLSKGVAEGVRAAIDSLSSRKPIKGLVLDLRYAGGEDYAAAAAVADIFVRKERPLLNWGGGSARAGQSGNEVDVPVAVLVNRQTSQAAEALAGALRETGAGLILGSTTAGRAMIYREFTLKNGDRLRIATGQVQLGDGSELPAGGVKPDIAVEVSPNEETAYYADAFRLAGAAPNAAGAEGTNTGRRVRINEAELVRERREGPRAGAAPPTARAAEPAPTIVHDPALARAIDVLKGLAVVRQARS